MATGPSYSMRLSAKSLAELYRDALAAPGVIQRNLRRGVKNAVNDVADAVRAGSSWSADIPGKVKTRVSFGRNATASVVIDDRTGEAPALNNNDRAGTFRHPVFPNTELTRRDWTWVAQPARPFFATSADPAADAAVRQIEDVMDEIAAELGFR